MVGRGARLKAQIRIEPCARGVKGVRVAGAFGRLQESNSVVARCSTRAIQVEGGRKHGATVRRRRAQLYGASHGDGRHPGRAAPALWYLRPHGELDVAPPLAQRH
jgi:hypothetical protein